MLDRLTESQIRDYSRKIFGFALSKTGDRHRAEDLAQDILLSLMRSLASGRPIERMDAWIYRICCYTWSNYVSKEKRYWRTGDIDDYAVPCGMDSLEDVLEREERLQILRREVAYLSRLHRDITVMYYYENRSIGAIAGKLGIPEGTVKWHLSEARKKIKEGMRMNQTTHELSYRPIRLSIGHSGTPGPRGEPDVYFDSLLASNIAVAAYERPVTVEEIARSLGVSSAYVEDCVRKFEHSELLRKVGKDKYQTNFVIDNMESRAAQANYLKAKAEELADSFYESLVSRLEEIKAVGFHGCHCRDAFLLWAFLPYAIHYQFTRVKDREHGAQYGPVERKDGGKYIVMAGIRYEEQELRLHLPCFDRVRKYATKGIKSRSSGVYAGIQMETWWSGLKWRSFEAADIIDMHRIVELIESGAGHTEYDKELISRMAKKGFVSHRNGELECLIPFFNPDQRREFMRVLENALQDIDAKTKLERVHDDFVEMTERFAPRHISKREIAYKAMCDGVHIVFAILENLAHAGKLAEPDEDERERLTTIMWMSGE